MRRCKGVSAILPALIALVVVVPALAQTETSIAGTWQGLLAVPGGELRMVFHITPQPDRSLKATLDSPDQGATGITVDTAFLIGTNLHLFSAAAHGLYDGQMDGDSFAGTWHQGGKDFLLVLHKLEKAEVPNSPQEPQPPAPHDTLQAAYPNPNAGTSTMGNAQVPAAKSNISTTVAIDQEVYPAVLKVMADMFLQRGIKAGTVRWELRNDGDEAVRVALTSQITEWTAPAVDQVDLEPHSTTSVDQSPFGTKLLTVQSAISLPVLLQAKVGDEVVFEETRSIKVNAADDWIFSKDKPYDVAPLIAAWVTPKDPSVEWVLSKAKEKRFGRSLGGYQEDVTGQIKAIFNEVRDLGVSYVSSTIDFARLGQSQRVRLPKEVIAQKSANCIDGAVLFASLFENIGLEPLIVLVPGHAFVGVRLAPGSSNVQFIETTMVGRSGLESVLTGERTYKAAMREGDEEFATARIAAQTNPNSVYLVDIKTARDAGIYPTW